MNPQFRLFLGCFMSLIATAFGFAVRAAILDDWRSQFDLSNEQIGYLAGVGLFPFAISIILLSLFIDRIGYGTAMIFAFIGHLVSALMTIFATDFQMLYLATFLFALANGTVEAVINPVVATVYEDEKTHWLNILHAGWPGGLVLGGLLAIGINFMPTGMLPGHLWQWQVGLVLIPTVLYGLLLFGQDFPVQERVAAGVSYMDMLKEFGAASCYIVSYLLLGGLNQILLVFNVPQMELWLIFLLAVIPTAIFAFFVRSFGQPVFVFLLLVMHLLATTELGTDSWIADIMRAVLQDPNLGTLFLVYTSIIMFILRFFAGPIVERISPIGLLAASAAIATGGLLWLANAGSAWYMLLAAATLYGVGKTFFWPTTLGVVSEQYPKGGALLLNAIAGVGMLAVGILGGPAIGFVQDEALHRNLQSDHPSIHERVMAEKPGFFGTTHVVEQPRLAALPEDQRTIVRVNELQAKQGTLGTIAILPAIMFVCYVGLFFYYQSQGGYKAERLTGGKEVDGEKFTGGVEGPVEA